MRKMRMQSLPYARTCLYIRRPTRTPAARTGDAVNILQSAAEVIGNTFSGIPGAINFTAVQHSTSPTMDSAITSYGALVSPFSSTLSELQPNTTYYYRAVVNSTGGTFLGEVRSFTTPQTAPAPAVNTGDAANITPDFATIINNSFSGIPGAINFVAVQYSISPAMSSPTMAFGTIGSPFSVNLTTLQPNATYYYRAAVNYEGGAHYGQIKSFTTPDLM